MDSQYKELEISIFLIKDDLIEKELTSNVKKGSRYEK